MYYLSVYFVVQWADCLYFLNKLHVYYMVKGIDEGCLLL